MPRPPAPTTLPVHGLATADCCAAVGLVGAVMGEASDSRRMPRPGPTGASRRGKCSGGNPCSTVGPVSAAPAASSPLLRPASEEAATTLVPEIVELFAPLLPQER
jgi:hypothetical protein